MTYLHGFDPHMTAIDDTCLMPALHDRACEALQHWSLGGQWPKLLKYRENAVFRVELADGSPAALRLHRPGYHSEGALLSELIWMDDLRRSGLHVPDPIPAADGRLLVRLEATARFAMQYADIIGWVDGEQLGETGTPLAFGPEDINRLFAALGATMADMHNVSDRWAPPATFRRPSWDLDGLLGDRPLWGRFWDCPGLEPQDMTSLEALRAFLRNKLQEVTASDLDYGLIHADLVRENVFVSDHKIALIDFDDCGYGWRIFDLATTLLKNRREPHYPLIRDSLLEGYRSRRALSDEALGLLPLFLVLRGLTYIGWVGERPELPDGRERISRYVPEALELAKALGFAEPA